MAWEDRTLAEQAQADQEAAAYRDADDSVIYNVVTGRGTRIRVKGCNSARAVAGEHGTYEPEGQRDLTDQA